MFLFHTVAERTFHHRKSFTLEKSYPHKWFVQPLSSSVPVNPGWTRCPLTEARCVSLYQYVHTVAAGFEPISVCLLCECVSVKWSCMVFTLSQNVWVCVHGWKRVEKAETKEQVWVFEATDGGRLLHRRKSTSYREYSSNFLSKYLNTLNQKHSFLEGNNSVRYWSLIPEGSSWIYLTKWKSLKTTVISGL